MKRKVTSRLTKRQWELLRTVARPPLTPDEELGLKAINNHSDRRAHWSREQIATWRPERWDPMSNAAHSASIIVKVRDESGKVYNFAHFAQDLSGEYQAPYSGWFTTINGIHVQVPYPVEWQPQEVICDE